MREPSMPVRATIGALLAAIAVGALVFTAVTNRNVGGQAQCDAREMQQVVNAIQARDQATIQLNVSTRAAAVARHNLLDALAHHIDATGAVGDYDTVITQYLDDLDSSTNAIRAAPLPDTNCLS